ncbi:hypothetical protein QBE52_14845 [Clostridiaceae bacterium 35-E11]
MSDINTCFKTDDKAREKLEKAEKLFVDYENKDLDKKIRMRILDEVYKNLLEVMLSARHLFQQKKMYFWEKIAFAFFYEDDPFKMESCFRKQAKLQPGRSDAFLNLGILWNRLGNQVKALEAYKEGLEINPKDEYIQYNLSALLEKMDCYYDEKGNKSSKGHNIFMGDKYLTNGLYKEALAYYEKAIEIDDAMKKDKMIKHLYENLIFVYNTLHIFDKAKEAIRKAEKVFPDLKYMAFEKPLQKVGDECEREYIVYRDAMDRKVYEGEVDIKNGRRHGFGIAYNPDEGENCVIYKGNFKNDLYEGYGLEYDKDGYLKYRGYWRDGRRHGQGTSFDIQGNMTYEGEFYEGKAMKNSLSKKQLF